MQKRDRTSARFAFTLIELLIVIGIIGVLSGLTLGAVQKARQAVLRVSCQNRLKQVGLGMHAYHTTHQRFPAGFQGESNLLGIPYTSWRVNLLPFVGEQTLHHQILAKPMEVPRGLADYFALTTIVVAYLCPADPKSGVLGPNRVHGIETAFANHLGVSGTNQKTQDGLLFLDSQVRSTDIVDGYSQTLMVGERPPSVDGGFGNWFTTLAFLSGTHDAVSGVMEFNSGGAKGLSRLCPSNLPYPYQEPKSFEEPCHYLHYWSYHPSGANWLFADGSVKLIPYAASSMMAGLSTRNGGEIPND